MASSYCTEVLYRTEDTNSRADVGEPRATHDLDVVVAIRAEDSPVLLSHFERPQFYLDEHAILEAIATGGMFNEINLED
jgi:hypothetical protein